MRVWLDPAKVQARGLTASDVVAALRAANVQVAAGAINQPPATSPGAFEVAVQTLGRLSSPEQFSDIVVATDEDGRVTRVRDIARVELGSQDYTTNAYLDNKVATAIGIFQRPGSNALATAATVLATMDELAKSFPPGLALSRRLQHHRVHPAIGRRGDQDAVRGGRPGRDRDHPVPADAGAPPSFRSSPSRCR